MKQIITKEPEAKVITLDKLKETSRGSVIAAYRCANSDAYCVLAEISHIMTSNNTEISIYGKMKAFGFIPLNGAGAGRFVKYNIWECIELASQSRKVYLFNSMREMLKAMLDNSF